MLANAMYSHTPVGTGEEWTAEWARLGIKEFEVSLRKHAKFDRYCAKRDARLAKASWSS